MDMSGTKDDVEEALAAEGEAMSTTDAAMEAHAEAVEDATADAVEEVEAVIEQQVDVVDAAVDQAEAVVEQATEDAAAEAAAEVGEPDLAPVIEQEITEQVNPDVPVPHDTTVTPVEPAVEVVVADEIVTGDVVEEVTIDTPPEETHWYFRERDWFGRKKKKNK